MLALKLRAGEYIEIGADIIIRVTRLGNRQCMLTITAPPEITILRGNLTDEERLVYSKPRVPQTNPFHISSTGDLLR